MDVTFGLETIFDMDSFDTVEESRVSYVTRARFSKIVEDPPTRWIAIKSASTLPEFSKQPHDILKELRLLRSLYHVNIIEVLGNTFERATYSIHFWMPFMPYSLDLLLCSPKFSPHHGPCDSGPVTEKSLADTASMFIMLARSLMFQVINGVAYIHDRGVAHRDIKPRNILLTDTGCVKVIDLGVAWSETSDEHDLWPEAPYQMCFDVSTGQYRAPELLFGPATYDAFAIDSWSLGATIAEFFTPLRVRKQYDDCYEELNTDSDEEDIPKKPFVVPESLTIGSPSTIWKRDGLFDASRGSIGLAWSIFKVKGTPTTHSWPTFTDLPDANKVSFEVVPAADLHNLLPHIPRNLQSTSNSENVSASGDFVDLVDRFLAYPPSSRLRLSNALHHPLFTDPTLGLLLPAGYPLQDGIFSIHSWKNKHLSDLLLQTLS